MHIFALLMFLVISAGNAIAAKRVALVIGNGAYQVQPRLRNPVGDARAIAAVLRKANFQVTLGTDLTNQAMRETINRFAGTVPGADAALLFFAGHGVQVDGENYLIPVDAKIERVADLTWQTIPVSTLVSELEIQGRTSIIILDACRNNAGLTRRLRGLTSRSRALTVNQGLAQVAVPNGAYVAFSTAPHTVATDGDGENSPFATALLKHMPTVGLDIALMMRRVRRDVRRMTNRQQTPWDSSSLTQPFYFVPGKTKPAATPPAIVPPTQPRSDLSVREAFTATRSIGTCKAYDVFLREYRDGFLSNLAKAWRAKNCTPQKRDLVKLPDQPQPIPPIPQLKPKLTLTGPNNKASRETHTKPPKRSSVRNRQTTTSRSQSKRKKPVKSKSCFRDCVTACIVLRGCEWKCNRQC